MMKTRNSIISLALLLPVLFMSCDSPSGSGASPPLDPSLENLWPSADGAFWTFAMENRVWYESPDEAMPPFQLYESEEDVPPAPDLDRIEDLLAHHLVGVPTAAQTGSFTFRFDGSIELDPQTVARQLVHEISWDAVPEHPAPRPGERLLGRGERQGFIDPVFFHNFSAWLQNDDGIFCFSTFWEGGYWTYLEDELEEGHGFSHVPVSELSYVLHGRVLGEVNYSSAATGLVRGALRMLYMLDSGVLAVTGESPEVIGYFRYVDYGVAIYAPGVGPVRCYERRFVEPGDPELRGWGELTLELTESSEID